MFESVLIANRGEIACRIIRTCRRLGIRSVAVFSDADEGARHVREADDAVRIGPAEASKSYLDANAILEAVRVSGAAAVHPGYGFLSEKPILARLCDERRIVWVGPRALVIEQMGSKTEAKKIAEAAGVALVPGYHGADQDAARLGEHARSIGFPILIKASAGGGGKGMRRVDRAEDFVAQLALAKEEARRAFGDDRVLLERLIQDPRHLEVQLAGDHHGAIVHLFERECSVQRHYQKVIEEAPAAWLTEVTRQTLFDYALRLGRAIRYDSLGTVEFVLEAGREEPYFLEMNTRLQVEHPVTEQVTGLDLIELQLRIAAGEPLPIAQTDVTCRGHAIEARINCENPARDYQPELGTIHAYVVPERANVRVESGVEEGAVVSPYYDSMIAKLVGSGATRSLAARSLRGALDDFETLGVGTNQLFVRELLARPEFLGRPLTTGFIEGMFPQGWSPAPGLRNGARAVAAFCELHDWDAGTPTESARARGLGHPGLVHTGEGPWHATSGFRNVSKTGKHGWARFVVRLDGERLPVALARRGAAWLVRIEGQSDSNVRLEFDGAAHVRLTVLDGAAAPTLDGAARYGFFREPALGRHATRKAHDETTFVSYRGVRWATTVTSELLDRAGVGSAHAARGGAVVATLPGLVTAVNVAIGDVVEAGDVLVVMESMKLIFALKAPIAGQVASVQCRVGQTVATAQALIEISPPTALTAPAETRPGSP